MSYLSVTLSFLLPHTKNEVIQPMTFRDRDRDRERERERERERRRGRARERETETQRESERRSPFGEQVPPGLQDLLGALFGNVS